MTNFSDSTRPRSSALQAVNPALQNDTSLQLALAIAQAADDRKGSNIQILPVGEVSYLADYFVLVTGFSAVQVRAISRSIEAEIEDQWHRQPIRTEGQAESSWILQDYGEVIVHIFMPEERDFYDLEAFWGHAEAIDFAALAAASEAQ